MVIKHTFDGRNKNEFYTVDGTYKYDLEGRDTYPGYGNAIIRNNIIIASGDHARGRTVHIFLVDNEDYIGNIINCPGKLEVYGVVSGQPGWNEEYGWIHSGSWVKVIERIIDNVLIEIEQKEYEVFNENQEYIEMMQDTLNEKLSKFENMFKELN